MDEREERPGDPRVIAFQNSRCAVQGSEAELDVTAELTLYGEVLHPRIVGRHRVEVALERDFPRLARCFGPEVKPNRWHRSCSR